MLSSRLYLSKRSLFITKYATSAKPTLVCYHHSKKSLLTLSYRNFSSVSRSNSDIFPDIDVHKKSASKHTSSSSAPTSSIFDEEDMVDDYADAADFQIKYPHTEYFASTCTNIHDVRDGGYITLQSDDIIKYLPEGLPKGIRDEFDHARSQSMMIRDSHKVLCRIVEEHEAKYNPAMNIHAPKNGVEAGYVSRLHLQGLSDRPEWPKASLRTYYYGKELTIPMRYAPEPLVAVKGPYSKVEKTITNIKNMAASPAARAIGAPTTDIPNKIMLSGNRGTGKSFALAHTVMYARKRGWLVLYVPSAWDHVQSGSYIEPYRFNDTPAASSPSSSSSSNDENDNIFHIKDEDKPSPSALYDNPLMTVSLLRSFWKAHRDILSTIKIQHPDQLIKYQPYLQSFREAWNRTRSLRGRDKLSFIETRAQIFEDNHMPAEDAKDQDILMHYDFDKLDITSVKDMIELGIAFNELAGAVIIDVVAELKHVHHIPVMIAVDEYNSWEVNSVYQYMNTPIHSRQLCVPHALSFISSKKAQNIASNTSSYELSNGICIASASYSHNEGKHVDYHRHKDSIPLLLMLPVYSQTEYMSAVSYYLHHRMLEQAFTVDEMVAYRTYCQSNPRLVRVDSVDYFTEKITMKAMVSDIDDDDDDDDMDDDDDDIDDDDEGYDDNDDDNAMRRGDDEEMMSDDPIKNAKFQSLRDQYIDTLAQDDDEEEEEDRVVDNDDEDDDNNRNHDDKKKKLGRRLSSSQSSAAASHRRGWIHDDAGERKTSSSSKDKVVDDDDFELYEEEIMSLEDGQPWDEEKLDKLADLIAAKHNISASSDHQNDSKLMYSKHVTTSSSATSNDDDDYDDFLTDEERDILSKMVCTDIDDISDLDPDLIQRLQQHDAQVAASVAAAKKKSHNDDDDYVLIGGSNHTHISRDDVNMDEVEEISHDDFLKLIGLHGENLASVDFKRRSPPPPSSSSDGDMISDDAHDDDEDDPEMEEMVTELDRYLRSLSEEELDELLQDDDDMHMRRLLDEDKDAIAREELERAFDNDALSDDVINELMKSSSSAKISKLFGYDHFDPPSPKSS